MKDKISFKYFLLHENELVNFPIHKTLNPKIWDGDKLKPEVKKGLLKIAKEFEEFLNSPEIEVKDIIFTGSLANYNYTKYSDIDLHLIVSAKTSDNEDCKIDLQEFFRTKKSLWNQSHDITIYGFPVELYAQLTDEDVTAAGVYSLLKDKWIRKPKYKKQEYDKYAVKIKAQYFIDEINKIINDKVDDEKYIKKITEKIKEMRKSGLEKAGEFSEENLAFKVLRNGGYIEKIYDYLSELKQKRLTIK